MGKTPFDIDRIFREKNPGLYKWIPGFLIRWIERIIHLDEMNAHATQYKNDTAIEFATHTIDYFNTTIRVINEENIPGTGRYIIVSNHPLGGLDGLALVSAVGKYRFDIKFPVNDLLMLIKQMSTVFVPINKISRNPQEAFKMLDDVFASDDLVLYFPAGLCSRRKKGVVADLEWKKTIIAKAKKHKRDVIPAYFDGQNSDRFYNLANFRSKIGVKANIEMLFLPDEMYRQNGKTFTITFGKPIPYTTFTNEKNEKEWAAWLKEQSYALKSKNL